MLHTITSALRRRLAGPKTPYPVDISERCYESEALPEGGGPECFDTPEALDLNRARLEHLEWMDLPLRGKSVLDVGCGVGHLAWFFLRKHCRVVCLDGREQNILALGERYPDLEGHVVDVQAGLSQFGQFDVVFSYGLLYHLENPVAGLRNMAAACKELLLLEAIVCDHILPVLRCVDETKTYNQALRGIGCRPSPAFVAMVLNRAGFPFVYAPVAPPKHPDFQVVWRNSLAIQQGDHPIRCVFVASRGPQSGTKLVPLLRQ